MLYLCYSINDIFVREAGISLIGFLENNPDYEPEEVFFLDYGIHPLHKEQLDDIASRYGKRITYLIAKPVTDQVKRDFPQLKGWRGSMSPNAKPFMDQIIPDYVERLLFIDADTVVAGSVSELQRLDMEGAALGVVPVNLGLRSIRKGERKLINGNRVYFNSGVLLFNMPVWRRENCHQMIIDTLKQKTTLEWPDQDLLNNAIPERLLKLLPLKYNYTSHYFHPRQERGWLRIGKVYGRDEIEEAIRHPAIIHYVGGYALARPWYERCRSSRSADYFRYKALSPWKDTPLFRPYAESHPPVHFQDKACLWEYKQYGERRSFLLTWLVDCGFIGYMWIRKKLKKEQKENKQ